MRTFQLFWLKIPLFTELDNKNIPNNAQHTHTTCCCDGLCVTTMQMYGSKWTSTKTVYIKNIDVRKEFPKCRLCDCMQISKWNFQWSKDALMRLVFSFLLFIFTEIVSWNGIYGNFMKIRFWMLTQLCVVTKYPFQYWNSINNFERWLNQLQTVLLKVHSTYMWKRFETMILLRIKYDVFRMKQTCVCVREKRLCQNLPPQIHLCCSR